MHTLYQIKKGEDNIRIDASSTILSPFVQWFVLSEITFSKKITNQKFVEPNPYM